MGNELKYKKIAYFSSGKKVGLSELEEGGIKVGEFHTDNLPPFDKMGELFTKYYGGDFQVNTQTLTHEKEIAYLYTESDKTEQSINSQKKVKNIIKGKGFLSSIRAPEIKKDIFIFGSPFESHNEISIFIRPSSELKESQSSYQFVGQKGYKDWEFSFSEKIFLIIKLSNDDFEEFVLNLKNEKKPVVTFEFNIPATKGLYALWDIHGDPGLIGLLVDKKEILYQKPLPEYISDCSEPTHDGWGYLLKSNL